MEFLPKEQCQRVSFLYVILLHDINYIIVLSMPVPIPAYRQKLKREAPALRTIQCWSDQSDAILQDCFDHVDWDMFRAASDDDIEAYTDSVTCFIRKCVEDVVPTKTIRIYPNQKLWINSDVRAALSARTSAFKSGNFDDRKQASYDLRKSIKAAKRQYKNKVEEQFNTNNARSMWQGINNITDCKGNKPATVNICRLSTGRA